eukprot:TRINITY_DN17075_c0_g1_i1.p1 TRINITY_DN17075_c0_g1~~TRINITY_DN17075_c0_g1_i1.p1  ORF type:complete len:191 (+),score=53.11 TRINITY_DN17075_c0_g1_i1:85-657(+)
MPESPRPQRRAPPARGSFSQEADKRAGGEAPAAPSPPPGAQAARDSAAADSSPGATQQQPPVDSEQQEGVRESADKRKSDGSEPASGAADGMPAPKGPAEHGNHRKAGGSSAGPADRAVQSSPLGEGRKAQKSVREREDAQVPREKKKKKKTRKSNVHDECSADQDDKPPQDAPGSVNMFDQLVGGDDSA